MKKKIIRICFLCLSLFWMGFIISNSLQSGAQSGEASAGVTEFINSVLQAMGINKPLSESFVRNAAHFSEFAVLSLLICSDILLSDRLPPCRLALSSAILALSVPFCFLFALLDEFTQRFSEGRASDFLDVLTDTSGAALATAVFIGCYYLIFAIKRKKRQKNN